MFEEVFWFIELGLQYWYISICLIIILIYFILTKIIFVDKWD